MENKYVKGRLVGLKLALEASYQSNASLSSATKGSERAVFIDNFLSKVLPSQYRFGTGDATDERGHRSGQLDVVVEHPVVPSLPDHAGGHSRLYLAEGVAAVIEVKSDVASQWSEVETVARQLQPLQRSWGATFVMGALPSEEIPLYAVGYKGWKTEKAILDHLASTPFVRGVLVIDTGLFVMRPGTHVSTTHDVWALWAFIAELHRVTNSLQAAMPNPLAYA